MIDAGLVWDAKTALQRARAFSEHNIFWLEEPLRPDDYEGYRRLSESTEVVSPPERKKATAAPFWN